MYQPPLFREDRLEVMHGLIRAHPFATLVTLEAGALSANHLPMILHPKLSANGTLHGHMARANPLWQNRDGGVDALAIFHGPQQYITPSWYPSKKEHGKVVPTWNYAVVHAHGPLTTIEDPAWLRAHLEALTGQQEGGRPVPWFVSDAPDDFIAHQLKGIVGFELTIGRIEGKWKVSQNRDERDRTGVSRGLRFESPGQASDMADLVERYGEER